MNDRTVVDLPKAPKLLDMYRKAAVAALPVIGGAGGGTDLPAVEYVLREQSIDIARLAEYTANTRLRLGNELPLTYPFVLTFPIVMKLMTAGDFPLPAMGMVHMTNDITRTRPLTVDDVVDIHVWAENLREHPKGMLVDLVSELRVGDETVWRQVSTNIRKQRTSLSGAERKNAPEQLDAASLPAPSTTIAVDEGVIGAYAAISGDRNPIHISGVGAKLFGFPGTIAHGMWSAATLLGVMEGRIPATATYSVRFGRPVVLPARIAVWARQDADGWELVGRHPKKLYPYLTATLR